MDAEHLQLIEDCENREMKMSEWERDFISSIRSWLESGKSLTPKQEARLNEIWDKVT